jgi:AmiR/NasT family two-component response regulator
MSESDAFAFIQKLAMTERVKMGEIAQRIISGAIHP